MTSAQHGKKEDTVLESDFFNTVVGDGAERKVSRRQLVDSAAQIRRYVNVEAKCDTSKAAGQIMSTLLDKLDNRFLETDDPWKRVAEVVKLNEDDFKPDSTTSLNETSKEILNKTKRQARANARASASSEAEGGGLGFGIGGFMLAANANFADAESESRADSRKEFMDLVEQERR